MTRPRYQEITAGLIPEVQREDEVRLRVIAGRADDVQGPVTEIAADPTYLDIWIPPNHLFVQPVERGHTAFAYVFEGEGTFGAGDREAGEIVPGSK